MDKAISRGFSTTHFYFHRAYDTIFFFCCETMTQRQATAASSSSSSAQRILQPTGYHAQQQQATPCACDVSAPYCVELLWRAPEIHHPSHLRTRARYLSAVVVAVLFHSAHNPNTAQNNSGSAKSTLQLASLSRPAAAGNAMRVRQIRAVRCQVAC